MSYHQLISRAYDRHNLKFSKKVVLWNGMDNHGRQVVSGIYMYRLSADNFVQTKRMTLVR